MKRAIFILLLTAGLCSSTFADGGRLRFSRTAGPFLVTLFTTPEPLTPGPSDFSVLVQDAKSGDILSDARVTFKLNLSGTAETVQAVATHGIATNRLLQAAAVNLPASGPWMLHVEVQQSTRSATLDFPIPVEPGSRRTTVIWIFASLPPLVIVLFLLHQRQKAYLARRQFAATTRKI